MADGSLDAVLAQLDAVAEDRIRDTKAAKASLLALLKVRARHLNLCGGFDVAAPDWIALYALP